MSGRCSRRVTGRSFLHLILQTPNDARLLNEDGARGASAPSGLDLPDARQRLAKTCPLGHFAANAANGVRRGTALHRARQQSHQRMGLIASQPSQPQRSSPSARPVTLTSTTRRNQERQIILDPENPERDHVAGNRPSLPLDRRRSRRLFTHAHHNRSRPLPHEDHLLCHRQERISACFPYAVTDHAPAAEQPKS